MDFNVLSTTQANSKHWFTTSFIGGGCRKAMLGVCHTGSPLEREREREDGRRGEGERNGRTGGEREREGERDRDRGRQRDRDSDRVICSK